MNLLMSLNFKNMAATQLGDVYANSLGVFNGELFAASASGLHKFVSPFSTEDDIEVVTAHFELPYSLLGYNGNKSPRSLLIAGRIFGAIQVDITDEEGDTISYTTPVLDTYSGAKIALQSNQRGRYFIVKVKNLDGSYFSIDQIDMVFIPGPESRK